MKHFSTAFFAFAAGTAAAQPALVENADIAGINPGKVEARFKADTTNWDLRLETDGFPVAGDNQGNLGNGTSFFEGRSFTFSLAYTADDRNAALSVTRDDGVARELSLAIDSGAKANVIQLFASGSRGAVDVSNIAITQDGVAAMGALPTLNVAPGGTTFEEMFVGFGNDANLFDSDFAVTANVGFSAFTRSNPGEGAKFNIKLLDATVIPAPGIPGTVAAAALGVLYVRRR